MHRFKSFGYHLLWTLYYLLGFGLCANTSLVIDNLKSSPFISIILLLAIITTVFSPIYLAKTIINRYYYNQKCKNSHAKKWSICMLLIVLLYFVSFVREIINSDPQIFGTISIIVFTGCMSLVLFITTFGNKEPELSTQLRNSKYIKIPDIDLKPLNIKLSNKVKYIAGGILIFLLITNPSLQAFKAHQGEVSYEGLNRKYNFFVLSIYGDGTSQYIGVLGNFIEI